MNTYTMNTERAHEIIDLLAKIEEGIKQAHKDSDIAFENQDDEGVRVAWELSRDLIEEKNDLRNELRTILN